MAVLHRPQYSPRMGCGLFRYGRHRCSTDMATVAFRHGAHPSASGIAWVYHAGPNTVTCLAAHVEHSSWVGRRRRRRVDMSRGPQPLTSPARSPNIATALNSCPNLSLTQGGCPCEGSAPACGPAGQGIVKCGIAANVPRSPPRRLKRWVNSPFANSMSTQPSEVSEIAPCLSRASPQVAASKCAGEAFSSWLENVSEQLRCSDCAPRGASDSVLRACHAGAGGRAMHVHRALQLDRRDGG